MNFNLVVTLIIFIITFYFIITEKIPRSSAAIIGGSALLDNVTTILLIFPISILIAEQLKIDFVLFLFTEIFSVNIGGAATLIGDPPNLIIGTKSGLGFNDFLFNMGPLVIINMFFFLL